MRPNQDPHLDCEFGGINASAWHSVFAILFLPEKTGNVRLNEAFDATVIFNLYSNPTSRIQQCKMN